MAVYKRIYSRIPFRINDDDIRSDRFGNITRTSSQLGSQFNPIEIIFGTNQFYSQINETL